MRLRNAVAAAVTTVVGAGAVATAAGRYASRFALDPSAGPPKGELIAVLGATADEVVLSGNPASARPGVHGLSGLGKHGVHATVGAVVRRDGHDVTRRLLRVDRGYLDPGTFVRMTPQAYAGDPRGAHGLEFADHEIAGELGPLPAWLLPGARSTWVIAVHGAGATREQVLPVLPLLHRFQVPVLVPAYRNDPGAPASPDRIGHLGGTEWHDLDAAMGYALDHGAHRLVLYGWSTGGTMALHALARSRRRDRVSGLVLDSPVLDWQATVRAAVRARGVPRALAPLAVRAAAGRTGRLEPGPADADLRAGPSVPTLLLHGPGDTYAPWAASRALAERRPDTVALHTVPGAAHAALWNADPEGYEEALRRFLTPLM